MNLLVAGDKQILKLNDRQNKLNTKIEDTGNAMTDDEVIDFSSSVNMKELMKYRIAVGKKTQKIIKRLTPDMLKQKIDPSGLKNVLDQGAVLDVEGANWLIDFRGRKTVTGILLMPVTRHNLVHINQSKRIKNKLQKVRTGN